MKKTLQIFSLNQKWLILFCLWLLFLTGLFSSFLGSPGILQAMRLNALFEQRKLQLTVLNDEVQKLESDVEKLEHNRVAQEKEIRKILGYAAKDEIIFDFIPADPSK